jgi:prophage maintenance system killer protein
VDQQEGSPPVAQESLAEFGGARGLRDEGLLDSALARPHNMYAYDAVSTIADLAAAYAFGSRKTMLSWMGTLLN